MMEEFNIQGKQTSFYKYCPGTFGYTLVCLVCNKSYQNNLCVLHKKNYALIEVKHLADIVKITTPKSCSHAQPL